VLHGIVLATGTASEASDEKYARMPQITVRYADGRELVFVPEARRRFFDEDDALKLAEVLEKASQIAEWSGVEERYARLERQGRGPRFPSSGTRSPGVCRKRRSSPSPPFATRKSSGICSRNVTP
jgi:hypothetical protein